MCCNITQRSVQALDIVDAASGASMPRLKLAVSADSVSFQTKLSAGVGYTLALSSLTWRDVGDVDPLARSLALAHSAARNSSALRRAHAHAWSSYWHTCATVRATCPFICVGC
jgi:hypothetical protein